MTDSTNHEELERLREHNKQLLAELKAARAELTSTTEALQVTEKTRDGWKSRWYKLDVEDPLETSLRGCAAGPWKYLRDVAIDKGFLKMSPDDEGIERPVWLDESGKPADLSKGLHHFLADVYSRTKDQDLGSSIRGNGSSGGGAAPFSSGYAQPRPERVSEDVREQPPTAFGLR